MSRFSASRTHIGWPFVSFVFLSGIGALMLLFFVGYQDLFALYETRAETQYHDENDILVDGEGVIVSFNLPIQKASLEHAMFPDKQDVGARIDWEDEWPGGYAQTVRLTPRRTPEAGEKIVFSLREAKSVFGTELPERMYAFQTEPIPEVVSVFCGEGTDPCTSDDSLTILWDGERDDFAMKYELESGIELQAQEHDDRTTLERIGENEDVSEEDVLVVRLFETEGTSKLVAINSIAEHRFPLCFRGEVPCHESTDEVEESE